MIRFLKYLLYGGFYLFVWAIAAGLVYLIFFRTVPSCFDNQQNQDETRIDCGGSCIDCGLKYINPLTVSRPLIFKNNDQASFWARIHNPNLAYGSDKLDYKVNFYDSQNNLLLTLNQTSFIYAGETKDILEAGVRVSRGVAASAELLIEESSLNWRPAAEWTAPTLEAAEVKSAVQKDQAVITGVVKNPSSFSITKVTVGAILNDRSGFPIGVSKTDLGGLSPFQIKNFQIFIPISSTAQSEVDPEATQIILEARK
ncbi:MAG: hypothetical protein Q8P76_00630 [bacterium]|nr:hypothetical protein [bacterium]